ncbi:SDR family NAD(P)-dependent oxidoreductase [Mucilaginibacter pedocola]|uniref:SDR family NAD(P)-dependent oxidoreductase n=1 Tax=Mucilaginibacter pedocola TaxID=1792845 RepID=UPI0021CDECCC|nr:SDR family NAD(P)-dependent oxidoreductase [Mucilaginibacter pedocola]
MDPAPEYIKSSYKPAGKLKGKVALITGGDSGIGSAVAVHYAKEGADLAIVYLDEEIDAKATSEIIEAAGRKCLLIKGGVKRAKFRKKAIQKAMGEFG